MIRRTAWLVLVALLVFGGLYGLFVWRSSYQKITIQFAGQSPRNVKIYRSRGDAESSPNEKDLVRTVTSATTFRLKRSGYTLVSDATNNYAAFETTFSNRESPVTITVDPDYSQSKLAQLTQTESPKVAQLIFSNYPVAQKSYSLQSQKILAKGDWFVARLVPNSEDKDVLRVVAHKTGGGWTLVTKPPALIVSKVDHPEIPASILSAVNSIE